MLKTVKLLFLISTAALSLSACSIISSLIPDQKVDLLGSGDGGSSEIVMPETALMTTEPDMSDFDVPSTEALKTQFSGANIPFFFSRGFDDLTESIGVTPESLKQSLGLTKLVLSGGSESTVFPDELNLQMSGGTLLLIHDGAIDKNVSGWDEFNADRTNNLAAFRKATPLGRYSLAVALGDKTISLQKDSANCSIERCAYKVANPESTYSQFYYSKVDRLMSFIGPDGEDDPKASIIFTGWYTVQTSLDTNLKASITFGAPAADMAF